MKRVYINMKSFSLIAGFLLLLLLLFRVFRFFTTGKIELNDIDTSWRENKYAFVIAISVHLILLVFAMHAIWSFFSKK